MPEHTTWFAFLPNYRALVEILQLWAGPTWFGKGALDLQHVFAAALVALLLLGIAVAVRASLRDREKALVPDERFSLRNFVEVMTEAVLGFMEEIMGKKASRYFFPLIGTCAFFIFFSNMLGFVPGLAPPTSNLNTTAACAVVIFVSTHVFGVREHGLRYFAQFFGPIRKWYALPLMLFMLVVELIGHCARPVSLSMRLMGNMFADHAVVGIFLLLAPVIVPVPLMFLGLLVCIVQTMVFILLAMVYIGSAVSHTEH